MSYDDFRRCFQRSEDELETRALAAHGESGGQSNFDEVPPHVIPELVDIDRVWHICCVNSCFFSAFHLICA